MTYARSEIFDPDEVGVYHCVSRCVRRAFLCGFDKLTGRSFEHRREWIRSRLSFLVGIFAIEVVAYAAMSNHLHSLIQNRPDVAKGWSPEEVARRWRTLFPYRWHKGAPEEPSKEEIQALVRQSDKIELYRERLSSISWFNRCLNENIARMSNAEDECTGRFWEGRFYCQRVFDVAGIIACAAYIDLNPIRAKVAKTLEGSDHTSVQDRIHERAKSTPKRCQSWAKVALVSIPEITKKRVSLDEYLELVEKTGRCMVQDKGSISDDVAPILVRLQMEPDRWLEASNDLRRRFRRVVGTEQVLKSAAQKAKKCWFHGLEAARHVFKRPQGAEAFERS